MATTTAASAPAALPTINYLQRYTATPDHLNGDYTRLYEPHYTITGQSKEKLLEMAVLSTQRICKVYLACVTIDTNQHGIIVLNQPLAFEPDLLEPSPTWDDKNFLFAGDVSTDGSNFIRMHQLPDNAFAVTDPQLVPTLDDMSAQYAASVSTIAGPYAPTNANTEVVIPRNLILIPHRYIPLVLNKGTFTPREPWEELGMAIVADGHTVDCQYLLTWIRVAATLQPSNTVLLQPVNHIDGIGVVVVGVFIGGHVDDLGCRWMQMDADG